MSSTDTLPAGLLSPARAATYLACEWHLRVSDNTIRRWIRKGALPATHNDHGRLLIDPADLHAIFDPAAGAESRKAS